MHVNTHIAFRRLGIKTSYLQFSNFSGETKNLIIFYGCFQFLLNSDIILFTKIHTTDFFLS